MFVFICNGIIGALTVGRLLIIVFALSDVMMNILCDGSG